MSEVFTNGRTRSKLAKKMRLSEKDNISVRRGLVPTSTYLMQPLRSLSAAKSMRKLETQFALDDERRARRYIANQLAEVYAPKEFFGTPCIIRDISETGACLEFHQEMSLMPDQLLLNVDDFQLTVECKPKWSDCCKMGLLFVIQNGCVHTPQSACQSRHPRARRVWRK